MQKHYKITRLIGAILIMFTRFAAATDWSVTLGDQTLRGYITNTTDAPFLTQTYTYEKYLRIDEPLYLTNVADSFFVLKGETLNTSYPDIAYVYRNLSKGTEQNWGLLDNELQFENAIFLKDGAGLYEITIMVGIDRRNSYFQAATIYVSNVNDADYGYLMHNEDLFFSGFSDYVTPYQLSREPTGDSFVLWGKHYIGGYENALTTAGPDLQDSYFDNVVLLEPSYLSNSADGYFRFRGINLTNEYPHVALKYENLSSDEEPHWFYITNEGYFERDVFFTLGWGQYKFTVMTGPYRGYAWVETATFYVTNTSDVDFRNIAFDLDSIKNKFMPYIAKDQFVREAYNDADEWNGIELQGYLSNIGGSAMITMNSYYSNVVVLNPAYLTNVADNFFVLRGIKLNGDLGKIGIKIENMETGYKSTFNYALLTNEGYFEEQINLGAGEGLNRIDLMGAETDSDMYYELGHFFVYNHPTTNLTFLLPSRNVPSDNPEIIALAAEITDGIDDTADQVKAVHDWVVTALDYDLDSYLNPFRRKAQDAVSVLENETAVCEGYSALFAALLRSLNIPTKIIAGTANNRKGWENHAWNSVWWDGDWHLIDVTWDDPAGYSFLMGDDDPAANLSYDYYDVDQKTFNKNHREDYVLIY